MTKLAIKEKLNNLEAEIKLLKTAVTNKPDFSIDESNWKKVKPLSKKIRSQLFKQKYA